jgi:hypothetical protein
LSREFMITSPVTYIGGWNRDRERKAKGTWMKERER